MVTLAHTLLFLIAEWTNTSEHEGLHERIDNFVLLSQVLNVSSAFEIHEDSVARMCSKLSSGSGMPSLKFLYHGDYIFPGPIVLLQNLPSAHLFRGLVNHELWDSKKIMRTSKIVIYKHLVFQVIAYYFILKLPMFSK